MKYYKKSNGYIASDYDLPFEEVTEEEYNEWSEKEETRAELLAQLDTLDLKCIRSLRAIQSGNGTDADTSKLAELEAQAEAIRQQLN